MNPRAAVAIFVFALTQGASCAAASDNCINLEQLLRSSASPQSSSSAVDDYGKSLKLVDLSSGITNEKIARLDWARGDTFVLVDSKALEHTQVVQALRESPSHFCVSGLNDTAARVLLAARYSGPPETIAIVPKSAAALAEVFGPIPADLSNNVTRQFDRAYSEWSQVPQCEIYSSAVPNKSIAKIVLGKIADPKQKGRPLVLFGHNESGVLKFPDGTTLPVAEVEAGLKKSGRTGVVLSCETIEGSGATGGILTTKRLDFELTAKTLRRVHTDLQQRAQYRLADYYRSFDQAYSGQTTSKGATAKVALVLGSTAVIGMGVLAIQPDDDESKPVKKTPPIKSPRP